MCQIMNCIVRQMNGMLRFMKGMNRLIDGINRLISVSIVIGYLVFVARLLFSICGTNLILGQLWHGLFCWSAVAWVLLVLALASQPAAARTRAKLFPLSLREVAKNWLELALTVRFYVLFAKCDVDRTKTTRVFHFGETLDKAEGSGVQKWWLDISIFPEAMKIMVLMCLGR